MAMKAHFRELATWIGRALEPRSWKEAREKEERERAAEHKAYQDLLAQLKPDDGTLAYIQDPISLGTSGVIVAIKTSRLMDYFSKETPDAFNGLGKNKGAHYSHIVKANHGLHVMPEITLDDNDVVRIREGRNRIKFSLQNQDYILVNMGNREGDSPDEFIRKVQLVRERFGVEGLDFTLRGQAAFCWCKFSDGPYPYVQSIERPMTVPYYSIKEPPAPTLKVQSTPDAPAPGK